MILDGLNMFGFSVEDLENHILPRIDQSQSAELAE